MVQLSTSRTGCGRDASLVHFQKNPFFVPILYRLIAERLHKHGGSFGGKTAGNDATGMHVNSTFSSAELQLLVDVRGGAECGHLSLLELLETLTLDDVPPYLTHLTKFLPTTTTSTGAPSQTLHGALNP